MRLTVNGEPREVGDQLKLSDLLARLGVDPQQVVVERNGAILRQPDFAGTVLSAGDVVEIVKFLGGG
ncbi:MAG: sulfur carrier protein ThiS [candidate division FCPU426 bacterium]